MKKALLYLRVSTAMQEEKDSLNKQKQESLDFIKSKGFTLYKIIEEVETGKNTEREGLKTLEFEIKSKKFDVLIFYSLSRLGRVQFDIHRIINLADHSRITYYSVTENFINSESEMGRMMLGIVASLAEQESTTISKRVSSRMRAYATQGYFLQKPPLGFDVKDKILVENEDGNKIRDIFSSYLNGEGKGSIAKRYNKCIKSIDCILKNPAYAGFVRFGGRRRDKVTNKQVKCEETVYKGLHKAIIEIEKYEAVQRLLSQRYISPIRSVNNDKYLLGGIVRCECGLKFYGQKAYDRKKQARQKSYYRCLGTSIKKCHAPFIPVAELEEAVIATLKKYSKDNFSFLSTKKSNKKIDNKSKIEKLLQKKSRTVEAYTDCNISRDDYLKLISKINSEISVLESVSSPQIAKIEIDDLKKKFISLLNNFDKVERIEQKKILQIIIKEVIILNRESFEIKLNII